MALSRTAKVRFYVELGKQAILQLLQAEGATVWPEVEAKIADVRSPGASHSVDPHHLTTARKELLLAGDIEETTVATRGGRLVTVQHLPLVWGRRRNTRLAAERKRLLYARHQGWAQPTVRYPRGLIGPAGEAVHSASLRSAALLGRYSFQRPAGGEVSHVLGAPVPGGPVDDYAVHLALDGGIPSQPVHVVVEVKNVRHWIYPRSVELYQLLTKATNVQAANPEALILPVLVCRRRHYTTLAMGRDLGFYVIETRRQYVMPSAAIHGRAFNAVRDGLGYLDLTLSSSADENLVGIFRDTLPRDALAVAQRWREHVVSHGLVSSQFRIQLQLLLHSPASGQALNALRTTARAFGDSTVRW